MGDGEGNHSSRWLTLGWIAVLGWTAVWLWRFWTGPYLARFGSGLLLILWAAPVIPLFCITWRWARSRNPTISGASFWIATILWLLLLVVPLGSTAALPPEGEDAFPIPALPSRIFLWADTLYPFLIVGVGLGSILVTEWKSARNSQRWTRG